MMVGYDILADVSLQVWDSLLWIKAKLAVQHKENTESNNTKWGTESAGKKISEYGQTAFLLKFSDLKKDFPLTVR